MFGVIGHNGSGKSTLMKIMAGIYRPTSGTVVTRGRLAALIELGAGFHPEMTGRENIRLNGAILGLSKTEVAETMDAIIDFSGLREFIDDPVKHYSSGMTVRLGFSVAVHLDPEVLLVDEVLAVGDEEFQRKCFDHLSYLRKRGTTIVLVSHALGQIESLCDQVAWIDHGQLRELGSASKTVSAYVSRVNEEESLHKPRLVASREVSATPGESGDTGAPLSITGLRIVDEEGVPLDHAETGSTFFVRVDLAVRERFLGPNLRLGFQHENGSLVAMLGNHRLGIDLGWLEGEHTVEMGLTDNPLLPGRYIVHVDVFDHTGSRLVDSWPDAVEFAIRSQRGEIGQGFVDLPASFRVVQ
jgi:ABC-2 type transport system ATP-binding protein/lipopolysaccharide transport system ATP-binding protein